MARVKFISTNLTTPFGELEVGDYFKYANELFVKLYEHKSPDYYEAVEEEGGDPSDYKENAFSFTLDDFAFIEDTDEVTPIFPEAIRIEVEE